MGFFDSLLGKKKPLKPAETNDKSAPVIEKDVTIKPSAMPDVKKELTSKSPALKPAETADKSAPAIDPNVAVKKSPMGDLLNEVKDKSAEYRQAENAKEVLADVAAPTKRPSLSTVKTVDKSAPVIESDVKLKMNPMAQLKKEIAGSKELKPAETVDKSAPVVDKDVKLKESPMAALSKEIAEKKDEITGFATTGATRVAAVDVMTEVKTKRPSLSHVEATADKSAPVIEKDVTIKANPMAELKKEIAGSSPQLKPAETDDKSAPKIEADVRVGANPMADLNKEIAKKKDEIESFAATGGVKVVKESVLEEVAKSPTLKAAETVDKSAPVIEKDVTIKANPMAELKKEIAGSSPQLKPAETVDKSAPMIEKDIAIKPSPMAALSKEIADKSSDIQATAAMGGVKVVKEGVLDEIAAKGASDLKHVEATADKSAPVIEKDVAIKANPMAELKKEIAGSSPQLKPAETVDKSAPMIEKDVAVKPSPMPALAGEIKSRLSSSAIETDA